MKPPWPNNLPTEHRQYYPRNLKSLGHKKTAVAALQAPPRPAHDVNTLWRTEEERLRVRDAWSSLSSSL
jgi:hypothetical protein